MVLPLLYGPPHGARGYAPDRTLEGDEAARGSGQAALRTGRSNLPQASAPGAAALGIRQPEALASDGPLEDAESAGRLRTVELDALDRMDVGLEHPAHLHLLDLVGARDLEGFENHPRHRHMADA